jgi:hypothetical protein
MGAKVPRVFSREEPLTEEPLKEEQEEGGRGSRIRLG